MTSLRTVNCPCLPVTVNSELYARKGGLIRASPPWGILSVTQGDQIWPIYGDLHPVPPVPTTFLIWTGGIFHSAQVLLAFRQGESMLPTPEQHLLQPGVLTLAVPFGKQLVCPASSCKQQATIRKTFTWWLAKILPGPGHWMPSFKTTSNNSFDMFVWRYRA